MLSYKSILMLITAAGAGGIVGFFAGKKVEEYYWKNRINEELNNYRKELDKKDEKIDEIKKLLNNIYGIDLEAEEGFTSKIPDEQEQVEEEAKRLVEHNRKLRKEYERYAEMYVKHDDWDGAPVHSTSAPIVDPAESEYPPDDDDYDDILKSEAERDKRLQEPGDHCVLITPAEMSDLPGYTESQVLFYYEDSDILTEEDGTLIDHPELVIGDCIERSGFRETTDDLLLVWNQEHRTIYEVSKIPIDYEKGED